MEKEVKNKKKYTTIVIIMMYLLIFHNVFQSYVSAFKYLDEIVALMSGLIFIIYFVKNKGKIEKRDCIICVCLLLITIIGIIANLKYQYQTIWYVLIDVFTVMKFFITYLGIKALTRNKDIHINTKLFYTNIKAITIFLFFITIINYIFKIFPAESRYGIMANRAIYSHPSYLAASCIELILLIIFVSKKIKNIYLFLCFIMLFSTLRFKAIGAGIILFILILFVYYANKKVSILKLSILGILATIIAFPQLKFYFIDIDNSARKSLTETSINIANDKFPLGTGFGTFASFVSGENYTEVYKEYGIDKIFGLEEDKAFFVSDSFWPMILGQFGYIGFILYCICLLCILNEIQKAINVSKYLYIIKLGSLIYLLIASVAESAFVNPIAVPFAILLGLQIRKDKDKENEN